MKPYLVLDSHQGIYFGHATAKAVTEAMASGSIKLTQARHCFYYNIANHGENKGVYGLAVVGPDTGSKIGPPCTMRVRDISKIVDCTPEAATAWEGASWGG